MPAHMVCSGDTDGWASELEGQLLETLRRDVHSQASFTGGAAAPCAGNANQGNSSNSLSSMQCWQCQPGQQQQQQPVMQLLQYQQMPQQAQRGAYRHYRAPDLKKPTQQQQQAYESQRQQQSWGVVPQSSDMQAAAGAPNMAHWQPSTLNYTTIEGPVNPGYVWSMQAAAPTQ